LHFFLLSLGDLEKDIFQFSPVLTMLTIPPSAHFGWGPQGKGVGSSSQSSISASSTWTPFFYISIRCAARQS
jgi:hypothetical protein